MRKITLFVFILVSSFFILHSSFALATTPSQEALDQLNAAAGSGGANIAGSGPTDPRMIAATIIRASLGLIGIIFVVLIIYAGFLWMTAGGEEEKASKAKKLIMDGVMGLAIILSAYAITTFVIKLVLGKSNSSCGSDYSSGGFNSNVTNYSNCGAGNPGPSHWYNGL